MSERPLFDPAGLLGALVTAGVEFVVIGGLAAQAHGSPSLTIDLDICPSSAGDNLDRLGRSLGALDAIRRDLPPGVQAPVDARSIRASDFLTLRTSRGDLDLLFHPEPGLDYDILASRAERIDLLGLSVRVASLDDLIAMKRAAGRPKDRIELEILGAVREEIDRTGSPP